jgi:hypothetical protein
MSVRHTRGSKDSTPHELVAKYVSALADASYCSSQSIIATDLSLYFDNLRPWFAPPMVFWADYVCHEVRRRPPSAPRRRGVVRYVPLREPSFAHIPVAQEHWLKVKAGIHWQLCPGPYNLVTFGRLPTSLEKKLNYCVIPGMVSVESPGMFVGNYETRVEYGSRGMVAYKAELVQDLLNERAGDSTDPAAQKVFPLYYRPDTFTSERQPQSYFRQVIGRFLWRLQKGICPLCGVGRRYGFDEMEIDHVIPLKAGGNNTLLNLEMKCRWHNNQKRARLSETQDYQIVLEIIVGQSDLRAPLLGRTFSMRSVAYGLQFPFSYANLYL